MRIEHPYHDPRWGKPARNEFRVPDLYEIIGDQDPATMSPEAWEEVFDYWIEQTAVELATDTPNTDAAWSLADLVCWFRGDYDQQERLPPPPHSRWTEVRDGNRGLAKIHRRHYSCRAGKTDRLVIGPGSKLALIIPSPDCQDATAAFTWRLERIRRDRTYGINCTMFRNESPHRASDLILDAEEWAKRRWPFVPNLFTFIDPRHVRPIKHHGQATWGYAWRKAGWRQTGETRRGLLIFQKAFLPPGTALWNTPINRPTQPVQLSLL